MLFGIYAAYQFGRCRYQQFVPALCFHLEENVLCAVVDAVDSTYYLIIYMVYQFEPVKFVQRDVIIAAIGEIAWELDFTVGELSCLLLCVDIAELHYCRFIGSEAVFLKEEGHENAVEHQHNIFSIDAVEHIVAEHHGNLAFHSVRFSYLSNAINVLFSNHINSPLALCVHQGH